MIRTGLSTLLEMTKCDCNHTYENLNAEIGKMKLSNILASMDSLKKGEMKCTCESVVVRNCNRLGCYFVELGQICDFMKDNHIGSFKEAIEMIAEGNSTDSIQLEANKFAVLIDEKACKEAVKDAKEAAKTDNKKLKEEKCEAVSLIERAYEVMQEQGVRCILLPDY